MRLTEQNSLYSNLEEKSSLELITEINQEDQKVAIAVQAALPNISALIDSIVPKLDQGGRIFYIGAGTSGRLGILDASECPPTFGVEPDKVIGIIAGGDSAIRTAVEGAEDSLDGAWNDLSEYQINQNDTLIGIAASGTTPYVIGGLKKAQEVGITTACIVCTDHSPVAAQSDFPIEILAGPEYITGSTRMKAGTAQKLVLNMISSACMIRIGKVKGNKMVDMQLSNAKLVDRAYRMIQEQYPNITLEEASALLEEFGSVRNVLKELEIRR